jgi:hypothetical protein
MKWGRTIYHRRCAAANWQYSEFKDHILGLAVPATTVYLAAKSIGERLVLFLLTTEHL